MGLRTIEILRGATSVALFAVFGQRTKRLEDARTMALFVVSRDIGVGKGDDRHAAGEDVRNRQRVHRRILGVGIEFLGLEPALQADRDERRHGLRILLEVGVRRESKRRIRPRAGNLHLAVHAPSAENRALLHRLERKVLRSLHRTEPEFGGRDPVEDLLVPFGPGQSLRVDRRQVVPGPRRFRVAHALEGTAA